ncbi:uncharacterized protein VICG_00717 [Vittaforma corneae ATCC 50505]|uniref:AAA+ ATPase domain-containing protein n=1 Tax=Vittaforma corneae (strain ATCC 50505) TaxID=993615 RepID=L2GPS1_VITCO|nr:uncharacterized protein VICG_00717 [Vittaforma corneae ATCC 50505]ELA42317.1 hypothetical protein VICG_00717 [Vittaforma corneae ATCC 50505]
MSLPFTEKYRPKTLDEIRGNDEVIECLKSFNTEDLPNMLFYGPPGTGKTTAIKALTRELAHQNILELNASDHRGIDTVRTQIKEFAGIKLLGPKIIVLDEADSMSRDAQAAIRRIIETSKNTRFCFICNYYKKIIEPIVSRCTKFRFSPVNGSSRIKEVCLKEDIPFDDEGIEILNQFSDGDMRKVMNDIQGIKGSYGALSIENVLEFFGMKSDEVFVDIFDSLTKDDFKRCKEKIEKHDVDSTNLVTKISKLLVNSSLNKKMEILKLLGEVEQRLTVGCSEKIQTNAIIAAFILNRQGL